MKTVTQNLVITLFLIGTIVFGQTAVMPSGSGTLADPYQINTLDSDQLQSGVYKLTASDAADLDRFGYSVAINGDYAIIASPYDDGDPDLNVGGAYIFKRSNGGWIEQVKLTAADPHDEDRFGYSVALDGDFAIVGVPYDDDQVSNSGSVYIFHRVEESWVQDAKLTGSGAALGNNFGWSVAIRGSTILVGASNGESLSGTANTGAVYVFENVNGTWTEQARLAPSDGAEYDTFGESISISGDIIVIGAIGDDDHGSSSGAAYVFEKAQGAWTQKAKLLASDGAAGDSFGKSVSIDTGKILVGAYGDDYSGYDAIGSVYAFEYVGNSWTQDSKLIPSDRGLGTVRAFGANLTMHNNYAVIGSLWHSQDGLYGTGAAYIFSYDSLGWTEQEILVGPDLVAEDNFGSSISMSGGDILIGAHHWSQSNVGPGSAYLFEGKIPQPLLTIETDTIDFRLVSVENSSMQSLSIVNAGEADLLLERVKLSGSDSASFNIDPNPTTLMSVQISGGGALSLTIKFTPDEIRSYQASLFIETSVGDHSVELIGTGAFLPPVGSGAESDPYRISSLADLRWLSMNDNVWNKHFIQVADINAAATREWDIGDHDLNVQTPDSARGFSPIGNLTTKFTGSYDGQFHSIDSLYLNRPASNYNGLFGRADSALLMNIHLGDVEIHGGQFTTGSIVGYLKDDSELLFCSSTGKVFGNTYVGGLLGQAFKSKVSNSYTKVNVTGNSHCGGFIGNAYYVTIENCYSRGDVNTSLGGSFGGFAGIIQQSALFACYSTGVPNGDYDVGGFSSDNASIFGNDIMGCFWDIESSGISTGPIAVGKTTAQMKELDTFTALSTLGLDSAWDFIGHPFNDMGSANRWYIHPDHNDGYPSLILNPGMPDLTTNQSLIRFGLISITDTIWYNLTLKNTGTGILIIDSVSVTGLTPMAFNIRELTVPIFSGDSTELPISFSTTLPGVYSAELKIYSNGGIQTINLSGTGSPIMEQKVTSSDIQSGDYFSTDVAIEGDFAIIGAYGEDENGSDAGAAYVFQKVAGIWQEIQKLQPTDIDAGERFGWSIGLDGEYAIISSLYKENFDSQTGAAYIFKRSNNLYTQQAKLLASDAAQYDQFGCSVAISGEYVIVGARYNADFGSHSGAAYIFKRNDDNWNEEVKLLSSDSLSAEEFGTSVDIEGATSIVGAPVTGKVFIYTNNDSIWQEEAKLEVNDASSLSGGFGKRVAISNNTVLVSRDADDHNGNMLGAGAAYVFTRKDNIWRQEAQLIADDATEMDQFGFDIDLRGNLALVGSHWDDDFGDKSGSAYLYYRSDIGWIQLAKLRASDSRVSDPWGILNGTNDEFGYKVALGTKDLLIGSKYDRVTGSSAGSAYFYTGYLDETPPGAPLGVAAIVNPENNIQLTWDPVMDSDLAGYTIFRDTQVSFVNGGLIPYAVTLDTVFIDTNWTSNQTYYYIIKAIDIFGNLSPNSAIVTATVLGVEDFTQLPEKFELKRNFPNPFNPTTMISYNLPKSSDVTLSIYDITGRLVGTLVNRHQNAGTYQVNWNASRYSSGVYFYRIQAGDFQQVRKMLLVK